MEPWELGRLAAGLPPRRLAAPPLCHQADWRALLAPPGPGHCWGWTAVSRGPPLLIGATQVPGSSERPPPPA